MIKNIADLNERKEAAVAKMEIGENGEKITRVLVGMATCGMAAGATPVYEKVVEGIEKAGLMNVDVIKVGCIGMCQHEPIIEILTPGKDKVTYVHVDAQKAERIVEEHLVKGNIVAEYNVGSVSK